MSSSEYSFPGYAAAVSGAAYFVQPAAGFLIVSGPDRLAFLQRQSTNDLQLLAPGRSLVTVLTSPSARIIDVLTLFISSGPEPGSEAGSLGALTLPGRGPAAANYLRSRIFFMDKVTLADASSDYRVIELLGPASNSTLLQAGLAAPAAETALRTLADTPLRLLRRTGGWRLLLPAAAAPGMISTLAAAGAEPLAPESYTAWRVEAGLPEGDFELVEEYTPLETGLAAAVSGSKGCYTGQEVIARQITYDKVTRQLVGLQLEAPAQPGERVWQSAEDAPAGVVTSAVESPRFGPIALAILKRPYYQPGTAVHLGVQLTERRGVVTALPFNS